MCSFMRHYFIGGMSAESSGMSTMNGMKSPYTGQSKAKASTSAYLLDQLLMVKHLLLCTCVKD